MDSRLHPTPTAFQLWTGEWFDIANPNPSLITVEMLAPVLARIHRFGGHCADRYSVAQHSLLVAEMLRDDEQPDAIILAGLLHDAHEALGIGDIIAPAAKTLDPPLGAVSLDLQETVKHAFDLPAFVFFLPVVRKADYRAYFAESLLLRGPRFIEYATDEQRNQAYADVERYRHLIEPAPEHQVRDTWANEVNYYRELSREQELSRREQQEMLR